MSNIEAVLFDLDGTLADTAADLTAALNATLTAFGKPTMPFETVRAHVSQGGIALIRLGFDMEPGTDEFEARRTHLLDYYKNHLCEETHLFDGMEEVLLQLEANNIKWGIVTNKPSWLTDPLADAMGLSTRTAAIVSGDSCKQRKPHPEPVFHACKLLGIEPAATIFVGDDQRDIEAGSAAGCTTVAATYGYLIPGDEPADWDANEYIDHPLDILELPGITDKLTGHG